MSGPRQASTLRFSGIRTTVNGETVQESDLSQLVFTVANLVATISEFTTLQAGNLILIGTPGGVAWRRTPQLLLHPGDTVSVEIDGIGTVANKLTSAQN